MEGIKVCAKIAAKNCEIVDRFAIIIFGMEQTKHHVFINSARRLIGSQIIESAAYCNQILLVP